MPDACAILDDYQNIALSKPASIADGMRLQVFSDHIADLDELVSRLMDFDIILAMRKRTHLGPDILDRLPNKAADQQG